MDYLRRATTAVGDFSLEPFWSRWVRIFSIFTWSSMQAMIRTNPPQAWYQILIRSPRMASNTLHASGDGVMQVFLYASTIGSHIKH